MRKILLIFTFILFSTLTHAGPYDKINESGFINKEVRLIKNFEIKDPKNKIILIYNHGQDENDIAINCTWVSMLRNHASLIDQEVNGKKIMVYNLCSDHLRGDMSKKKDWWYLKPQPKIYEGKHMLDKRVELNLELIEKFVDAGVPRKQVFVTGHSCGGLTTLLFMSRYPDKVGGGISYMQACFGKLSSKYKVKKNGVEKAMAKFRKKYQGPHDLRQKMNDEIKNNLKVPILAFTHPKDKYEGLLSDWLEEIPGMKRIVISENYKINGKSCKRKGDDWEEPVKKGHDMDVGLCFQYYNPTILDYISSRLK
jgi:predicted esterase